MPLIKPLCRMRQSLDHQHELPFHVEAPHCPCPACGQRFHEPPYSAPATMAVETSDEDFVKNMVDGWDERRQALVYKYLYLTGMRIDKAEQLLRKRK